MMMDYYQTTNNGIALAKAGKWKDLSKLDLSDECLDYADFVSADLRWANLRGSSLLQIDAVCADFYGARMEGVVFSHSFLTAAKFSMSKLIGASFINCEMTATYFRWAYLPRAKFEYTTLIGADFFKARLEGACFEKTYLIGTDFEEAYLGDTTFEDCRTKSTLFQRIRAEGLAIRTNRPKDDL